MSSCKEIFPPVRNKRYPWFFPNKEKIGLSIHHIDFINKCWCQKCLADKLGGILIIHVPRSIRFITTRQTVAIRRALDLIYSMQKKHNSGCFTFFRCRKSLGMSRMGPYAVLEKKKKWFWIEVLNLSLLYIRTWESLYG